MLKSFTLKNFKSFKEATLPLTPTVTFLIGANGSGKSNALEALRLLHWLAEGRSLEDLENNINSAKSIVRCPSYELFRYNERHFDINSIIKNDKDEYDFLLSIEIQAKKKYQLAANIPFITLESLTKNTKSDKYIIYKTDDILPDKTTKRLYGKRALFSDVNGINLFLLLARAKAYSIKNKVNEIKIGTEMLNEYFSSIFFIDPVPKEMRGYVKQFEGMSLSESGDNLSAVLEELCRDEKIKRNILEIVHSLPEQDILDIDFSRTDENFFMLRLEESYGINRHMTPAYSLSDGTLRVLAIAAALYGAPKGSLLVIEEVDNGIHPSRIQHLVDKMYEIAAERKIQILVTTHDPAMMNAIPPQEKGNVLCCYRSKEDGTSKILRLSDSPHADSIIIGQKLGDSVTTEQFDSQIKDTRSAQEVHEAQMKWLEQFMQSVSNFDKEGADE